MQLWKRAFWNTTERCAATCITPRICFWRWVTNTKSRSPRIGRRMPNTVEGSLMNFETLVFYMFAAMTVFAAVRVITVRNPVHAALFLVLAFCSMAGIWLLLEAEFLAITLILVYVGAVMVLFLFVVMMLDINLDELREGFTRFAWLGAIVTLAVIAEIVGVVWAKGGLGMDVTKGPADTAADYSNTLALGEVIYTKYAYPFELAA